MNVLMISPGFPAEMPFFTRALSVVGAKVIGIGDQPQAGMDPRARRYLSAYVQIPRLWDDESAIPEVLRIAESIRIDRVECLWEPGMLLAAKLREALSVPGMTVAETIPFRDKEQMKLALDAAGIRTPRHARAVTAAEVREAVDRIGYPVIVKPIAGAGSADTHRVDDDARLDIVLKSIAHVPEVSVEEFIEGAEYTYDTICSGGEILYENVSWYRPRPLIARTLEWVSPQTVCLRRLDRPEIQPGLAMGREVIRTLGFSTGFTHMEWFLTDDGEAVFGEIAARAPGAKSVDIMNYAGDVDLFNGWAEAVVDGRFSQRRDRLYNAVVLFKRAQGQGRIQRIEGLDGLLAAYGPHVVGIDLLSPGAQRRNWKQTLLSDGWVFLRHPDLQSALTMADRFGTDLQIYAS